MAQGLQDPVGSAGDVIALEQFLDSLPSKKVCMYERNPETWVRAGELANEY